MTAEQNAASVPERRARRAPGHIQELIVQAARDVFAEKGYARATTREIAARADVAETLLFRNFGSKANLFGEVVLRPMAEFLERWATWNATESNLGDTFTAQEAFTREVYEAAHANKGLLLTFVATGYFEPEVLDVHEAGGRVQAAIEALIDGLSLRMARLGIDTTDVNVGLSARAAIAMILAVATFDDLLLPRGKARPDEGEIVRELSRLILFGGFNLRPGSGPAIPATPAGPTVSAGASGRSGRGG